MYRTEGPERVTKPLIPHKCGNKLERGPEAKDTPWENNRVDKSYELFSTAS